MKLRDIIDSPCGLRYVIDSLPLVSGYSLRYLMDTEALTAQEDIAAAYSRMREHLSAAGDGNLVSMLHSILCSLKDISHTLSRIEAGSTVDDIELFEVKALILLGRRVSAVLEKASQTSIAPHTGDLEDALKVLDPDGTEIASFYIYDSYSPELAALRADIRREADADLGGRNPRGTLPDPASFRSRTAEASGGSCQAGYCPGQIRSAAENAALYSGDLHFRRYFL